MPARRLRSEPACANILARTLCGTPIATHLLEAGTDLRTIQLLLGHTHLEDTTVYLHLSQQQLHTAINPLDQVTIRSYGEARRRNGERAGVTRPPFEVADIIRKAGTRFIERYRESLSWAQLKVLTAIARCRTAALGGHRDQCARCGYEAISYCSCRNRHCPKCQTNAREKWLRARERELLPVGYYHLVFSVPHALVPLIWQNKRVLFTLLFEASATTLLEVAADPKHLGAQIGFLSILHTWGQTLQRHPHIHCVVPGGGLSPDGTRWISSRSRFFLPVRVLSRVFRGKFVAGLRQAFQRNKLVFHGVCLPLAQEKAFAAFLRTLVPAGLGRVRQAPVWWTRARSAVLGALHASRRHLQPSIALGRRQPSVLSLEGLCPSQQATHAHFVARRVPATLSTARIAQGLSAHSLFRLARESKTWQPAAHLPESSCLPAAGNASSLLTVRI